MNNERTLPQATWDFFCSLKLAMALLLSLAITSIIGTVIPQGNLAPQYLESIGQTKFRLYQALGFFDMYHSWWFVLLLVALSVNLFACSFKRLPQIWKVMTNPTLTLDEGLKKSLGNLTTLKVSGSAEALTERVAALVAAHFATPRTTEKDGSFHLYAEKTPWCRLAVYAVHVSILVIFAGAIVGSLFGFKGYVTIPEGGSASSIVLRNDTTRDLGFSVNCEKFSVSFYDTGAPKEFKSILTVTENGRPVAGLEKVPVIVNSPLTYKGITFYQSSYGKVGQHNFLVSTPEGGNPVQVTIPSEGAARLPDGSEVHVLEATQDVGPFLPGKTGPAAQLEMHTPTGKTFRIVAFGNYPELNREAVLREGHPAFRYLGGTEGMYTGLQVNRDPGVAIVWLGCLLMVVGVYVAFFMSHRRVWVQVKDGEVVLGGNANKNPAGFELAFDRLVQQLKGELAPGEEK
ncbi:cytochrome c biogenesis protein ResB [Geomonas silvestris]|uniref:Cytochrome c biogenesis protein ResB n=1 Tax=Geomonas silvestris TaxID=2740184 RepID=A0A6V8MJV7_9BACT|nr:cytochrome c biogenesis protein ResB [Geomonas silvestris]GFO60281.1 cytochrome c biogenesis protein ResB [Geomonas silvestris]